MEKIDLNALGDRIEATEKSKEKTITVLKSELDALLADKSKSHV